MGSIILNTTDQVLFIHIDALRVPKSGYDEETDLSNYHYRVGNQAIHPEMAAFIRYRQEAALSDNNGFKLVIYGLVPELSALDANGHPLMKVEQLTAIWDDLAKEMDILELPPRLYSYCPHTSDACSCCTKVAVHIYGNQPVGLLYPSANYLAVMMLVGAQLEVLRFTEGRPHLHGHFCVTNSLDDIDAAKKATFGNFYWKQNIYRGYWRNQATFEDKKIGFQVESAIKHTRHNSDGSITLPDYIPGVGGLGLQI